MSLELKFFVILMVASGVSSTLTQETAKNCDELKSKIIVELFNEKNSVMHLTQGQLLDTSEFLKCENLIPIVSIGSVHEIPDERQIPKSIMIDFDLNKGMIIEGSLQFILEIAFPRVAVFNHKMRILLLICDEISDIDLIRMFNDTWEKFKIFDIFLINLHDNENDKLTVYSYFTFHSSLPENRLVKFNFTASRPSPGFDSLRQFIKETRSNLNGFKLRAVIFPFMMVCSASRFSNGSLNFDSLKYQDAENLKILSKFANFTVKLVDSPDKILHGFQNSNNKFTGSLGMVEYENADLAANSRTVAEYNTSNSLFLFPTTTMKLKFAVPKKLKVDINLISSMINLFDSYMLWSFPLIFMFTPFLLIAIEIIYGRRSSIFEATSRYYLMIFAIMTSVSINIPNHWTLRLVIIGVVLFWLNIGSIYSGKMIEFLNTNYGLRQIKSIDEMSRAQLEIKIPYPMITLFEQKVDNMTKHHKFIHDVVVHGRQLEKNKDRMAFIDIHNMDEMINSKRYGLMFLDFIIEFLEQSHYDEAGNERMTHFDETPYEYYWAMTVPKTSPFVPIFNRILQRSFEAGIAKFQMNQARIGNHLIMIRRLKAGKIPSDDVQPISLNQIFPILMIYAWCVLSSVAIFIAEFIFHKLKSRFNCTREN